MSDLQEYTKMTATLDTEVLYVGRSVKFKECNSREGKINALVYYCEIDRLVLVYISKKGEIDKKYLNITELQTGIVELYL